jgi:hypothetical protein
LSLIRVLQVASAIGALAALVFLWRGQWDGVLVAAALGSVAWFVRLRIELSDLLPSEKTEENDEN